jgi:signal transduction histidine kinase
LTPKATPGVALVRAREGAELQATVEELRLSLRRLSAAGDAERQRLERDLHDGAQQRLVAVRVKLGLLRDLVPADDEVSRGFDELEAGLDTAFRALRQLAHDIYPTVLGTEGLGGALRAAADRCDVSVTVKAKVGRYPAEIESAVYYSCSEALQNAAKHAGPDAEVSVFVGERGNDMVFAVADDGQGFDASANGRGRGIESMEDRIRALGGQLVVESAPAHGTTVRGRLPLSL